MVIIIWAWPTDVWVKKRLIPSGDSLPSVGKFRRVTFSRGALFAAGRILGVTHTHLRLPEHRQGCIALQASERCSVVASSGLGHCGRCRRGHCCSPALQSLWGTIERVMQQLTITTAAPGKTPCICSELGPNACHLAVTALCLQWKERVTACLHHIYDEKPYRDMDREERLSSVLCVSSSWSCSKFLYKSNTGWLWWSET